MPFLLLTPLFSILTTSLTDLHKRELPKMRKLPLIILISIFLPIFSSSATASGLDSLLTILEQQKKNYNSIDLLQVYEEFLQHLNEQEKFSDLISNCEKAIPIAKKYQNNKYLGQFLYFKALANQRMGSYTEALTIFGQVIPLAEKGARKITVLNTLSQISSIYQQLGNFEKAYDYQMKALRGFEQLNDLPGTCRSNYVIGTIFYYQKQYDQALTQYLKALAIAEKAEKPRLIYSSLGALGATYDELNNWEEGLYYNNKALELAKKIQYDSGIAYTLSNIGLSYLKMGNCAEAETSILASIKIKEKLKDPWGIMGSKFALVQVYRECSKDSKVLPVLQDALEMSKKVGSKSREMAAYEEFISYYDNKDTNLAYHYTKKYIALKDTVLNEKTLEEMGQSRERYELEKKEHEILMLKAENKILNINKENQRLYGLLFAVSIIFLLITIFWFFSRIKMHRRINEMLESKNDLLNLKNEEIRVKNKQLEHSNEDLAQFAYVASHDLKEPLRMIHSYTTLIERRYNDKLDESGKEFMHYIVDAVDRMKNLLDDLLDYSRSGKQEMPDTLISVADMMIVVEANLKGQIEDNKGSLIVRNENLPSILAHKSQLMQLLQNLVSNGMKFRGERDPIIIIDCVKKNDQFIFSVKDNGIGISKTNQEKVFEMFRRLHTREEYAGTGIGLATCKKIVSNMGGDIWVESEEGVGSTFFFAVPCPAETMEPA